MIHKIITVVLLGFFFSCSSFNVKEDRDDFGRVNRIFYYDGNKLLHTESIKYYGKSRKPKVIIYKKEIKGSMVSYRQEVFHYKGNILTKIEYYVLKEKKKIKTGMLNYFVKNNKLHRVAYYGFGLDSFKYRIGLDYYLYGNKNKISSRRIITYYFDPLTKKTRQTGHYVLKFKDDDIVLMEYSYIKQTKAGAHVEKKVWNKPKEINIKLKQIIQSLVSKAIGSK